MHRLPHAASAREAILHLSCISGVGPTTIMQLYQQLGDALAHLYTMSVSDIVAYGMTQQMAQRIHAGLRESEYRDHELCAIERVQAAFVTLADSAYPELLRHIPTPPPVIYYKGDISCVHQSVGIIGSRKAGTYARQAIERIVPDIVAHDLAIVSGGAYGADTLAHNATLRAGGVTAAVLGSGLAHPYPQRNRRIFRDIIEAGGVVLTPFTVGTKAQAHNFPVRNRVIAGLARAIVVVQAAQRSGTHITASYALEAGREVGAVPGRIDDPQSEGVHSLLRDGAYVVTSGTDVLHMCGISEAQSQQTASSQPEPEDPIVALCHHPQQFDALLSHSGLTMPQLQQRLMELQLSGHLYQDASGCWCAR